MAPRGCLLYTDGVGGRESGGVGGRGGGDIRCHTGAPKYKETCPGFLSLVVATHLLLYQYMWKFAAPLPSPQTQTMKLFPLHFALPLNRHQVAGMESQGAYPRAQD